MNEMAKTVRENNIQVSLGGGDEGSQLALILAVNILEGDDSGGLLVDDRAETGLALDDDVGNTHLAAKSGKEDNELNGVVLPSVVVAVGSRPVLPCSRFTAFQ